MPRYYLGIDGGQSSTTALIADEQGRVLGSGHSGPCNHVTGAEARDKFLRVIGDCIRQASSEFSTLDLEFAAACAGFSGGPEDKLAYARELIRTPKLKVTNDAEIALTGALGGQPGIIAIAGTGSIAFGRNAEGRSARAGGWGYIFGDEGGAFDIVRRALRASLQLEEGWGEETRLHALLLRSTNTRSANELLHRLYSQPRNLTATLAPLVTECAEEGDTVAVEILSETAGKLAWYVQGVHRNLFGGLEHIPVAHIGGVFQSEPLRKLFSTFLRDTIGCPVLYPKFSPAAGALLEALYLDDNSAILTGIPETKT